MNNLADNSSLSVIDSTINGCHERLRELLKTDAFTLRKDEKIGIYRFCCFKTRLEDLNIKNFSPRVEIIKVEKKNNIVQIWALKPHLIVDYLCLLKERDGV